MRRCTPSLLLPLPSPLLLLLLLLLHLGGATAGAPGTTFDVVVGLTHRNLDTLEDAFWAVSTPGNPRYMQHLSLGELSSIVGANDTTIERAEAWLYKLGATSTSVHALRDAVVGHFDDVAEKQGWSSRGLPLAVPPTGVDYVMRLDPRSSSGALAQGKKKQPPLAPEFGRYTIEQQKKAYGIPIDLAAPTNTTALQMVWGPGTFGFSKSALEQFAQSECPLINVSRVNFDTSNHGQAGGDNWGEGTLDVHMITSFGLNVNTLVSNTNTSASTEEGNGFGQALLSFLTELSSRQVVPHVLSLSLGSLSPYSCDLLCDKAVAAGFSRKNCDDFLQEQRQVCMYLSTSQAARIDHYLQVLGARGVTIFGSSGDGGSHFSFEPFDASTELGQKLNDISCAYQMPIYPSPSPYMTSVGGTQWKGFFSPDPSKPVAWSGSGGGFSWQFPMPSHQRDAVEAYVKAVASAKGFPSATSYNASGRAYPDVSAVAIDGTSQSSPTVAGIFSLLTSIRLDAGLPPLGFLGPRLYQVSAQHPGEAFEDVTEGNSATSCDNGFPATKGWDPVTGWGRPVWAGIVKYFGSD